MRRSLPFGVDHDERDLLILGGGIVGTGVARDAARRGLRVALLERRRFGWGTSSRTSRLIHGGIRYLEQGNLALVRESLAERAALLALAPGLVHATPFLFVLDRGRWWQWLRIGVGVTLYRLLAAGRALGPHHPLTRAGLVAREPLLAEAPLLGGALYQDARGDDLGLVRFNVDDARAHGALLLEETDARIERHADHVEAFLPDGGRIRARGLVLALGPWTDIGRTALGFPAKGLVKGTKGVHITFDIGRLPLRHAITLRHPDDDRVMFCVPEPERGRILVGTTDTDTDESPDHLTVGDGDVRYLLRAVRHLFPARALTERDIAASWAGLRPLLAQQGRESSRSREHLILTEGNVTTVAGGKLTTYRRMAEEVVDRVAARVDRTAS